MQDEEKKSFWKFYRFLTHHLPVNARAKPIGGHGSLGHVIFGPHILHWYCPTCMPKTPWETAKATALRCIMHNQLQIYLYEYK